MKVLNLRCTGGHVFEGWFGSENDYQTQKLSGLLVCPVCGNAEVEKGLSAPRLKAKSNSKASTSVPQLSSERAVSAEQSNKVQALANIPADIQARLQVEWMHMARKLVATAEDVGADFADEARRIHSGDAPERAILGQATPQEANDLLDEGIAILPLPEGIKNSLQ